MEITYKKWAPTIRLVKHNKRGNFLIVEGKFVQNCKEFVAEGTWCRFGATYPSDIFSNPPYYSTPPVYQRVESKVVWKSKILVHCHVRIFLNFVYISAYSCNQNCKLLSKLGLLLIIKHHLKMRIVTHDYVVLEIFAEAHFG